MERCIKETLRLYPSVPIINRISHETFKSSTGYIIPKGITVQIPIIWLHRSEALWKDPSKFDPDRFLPERSSKRHPYSYIPFSAGPRNCIGKRFDLFKFILLVTLEVLVILINTRTLLTFLVKCICHRHKKHTISFPFVNFFLYRCILIFVISFEQVYFGI